MKQEGHIDVQQETAFLIIGNVLNSSTTLILLLSVLWACMQIYTPIYTGDLKKIGTDRAQDK